LKKTDAIHYNVFVICQAFWLIVRGLSVVHHEDFCRVFLGIGKELQMTYGADFGDTPPPFR